MKKFRPDSEIGYNLDILLVMPPSWGTNMPPLGLEYINAYLQRKGYSSETFDMNIDLFSRVEECHKKLWSFGNHRYWVNPGEFGLIESYFGDYLGGYADYLLSLACGMLGFSINAGNRLFTFRLINEIKRRARGVCPLIIVGGPLCRFEQPGSLIVPEFLEAADIIVAGEGEEVAADIVSYYKEGRKIPDLPGVLQCKKPDPLGGFIPPRLIRDLNGLPFPRYRQEEILSKYTERVIPLLMGRGCLGRCSFCDARFFQPGYRIRDALNVFEEIKHHIAATGVKNFTFNDLAVNWDLKKLEELCDLIINRNLDIIWNASATIRKAMTGELLKKIEKAGCSPRRKDHIFGIPGGSLIFGLESGSDKVLGSMNKRYSAAEAEEVLRMSHDAGISTVVNFIAGFPGETEREHRETLEFIKKNRENITRVGTLSLCYIPDFSELKKASGRFGITFPEADPMYDWHDSGGNNYEVRKRRTLELIGLASDLGIPPLDTTLNYGERSTVYKEEKKKSRESHCEDILLIVPPPWGVDVPPLGVACLCSFLREKGFSAKIFDFNIELYSSVPDEYKELWSMNYGDWWHDKDRYPGIRENLKNYIEPLIERIIGFPHKVIGFSLASNCPDLITAEVVKRIKEKDPERVIILGGVSISIPEQRADLLRRIEDLADYCVVGEGEEALCKLMDRILKAKFSEIKNLQGVLTKREFYDDRKKADFIEWKGAPFPDFEGIELERYTASGRSLPIEFSRGCIGNCPFCDFKSVSPFLKSKSAQSVLDQIKFYIDKYSINHLTVVDPAVNSDIGNLKRICDLLIEDNVAVRISALAIPRKEMSHGLLAKMKRANFYRLEYGLESGSNRVLKGMRKIFTAETAERVIRDTHRAGINTYLYLIVGYPEETEVDFNDTKEFLKRNDEYITMIKSINPLYIMAGSEIFYNPRKYRVSLPPVNSDREWYIGNENTYDIRKRRVIELKDTARKRGIPFTEEAESLEFTLGFSGTGEKQDIYTGQKGKEIILALCPPWDVNMPPLAIAYLSRYLRAHGIAAQVLDMNIEIFKSAPSHMRDLWLGSKLFCWTDKDYFNTALMPLLRRDITRFAKKVSSMPERIVGFSVNRANLRFTIELARAIKKLDPDKVIIFGGHACSIKGEKELVPDNTADILVSGEGEGALVEIVKTLTKNEKIKNITRCIVKDGGTYLDVSVKEPIKDLDFIPFPDFVEFNLKDYQSEMLPLLASRGCINRCSFCNDWVVWPKYRSRTAENIFKELLYHVEVNKVNAFEFVDLALSNNTRELERLCDLLINSDVAIKWIGNFAVIKMEDINLFKKMKRAGCVALRFGIESGSDNVLKKMNKRFTAAEAAEVLKESHRAQIENHINIIVGFPGEKDEDFLDTLNFIIQNKKYINRIANVHPCYLTPKSEIEKNYRKYNIVLPKADFALRWQEGENNTYEHRKENALKIARLTKELDIHFDEKSALIFYDDNITERAAADSCGRKAGRRRNLFKWSILAAISLWTFFYIVYFRVYMILRGKLLLGGKKE